MEFVLSSASKPSNPLGKMMPVQVCERNLAGLFRLLEVRPKPESIDPSDLSGLEEIECSQSLEYCLIDHVARQLQLLLPEIYRKLGERPELYRKPGRTEQAAFHRYRPLPPRPLPERSLRIRNELDEELWQQYPECLRLSLNDASMINPGNLFFDCTGDYLDLNSIVPANPILDGAFLDLKRCFPELDLYCDPTDYPKPIVTDRRTRKQYVIRAEAGWDTCIVDIIRAFLARSTLPQAIGNPISKVPALEHDDEGQSEKSSTASIRVKRGAICVQVKKEIKRVRYMAREQGRSIKEIMTATPGFKIWEFAESENLSQEDREMIRHPNQWETGYAQLLLSKYFQVQRITIRDYVTAYNKSTR